MRTVLIISIILQMSMRQLLGTEPVTITVDRNWNIPESTKVGSIVKTVRASGSGDRMIEYTLSVDDMISRGVDNPFWIHPHTGFVYLNKSLEGRVRRDCCITLSIIEL
jgi:hypothetical protein